MKLKNWLRVAAVCLPLAITNLAQAVTFYGEVGECQGGALKFGVANFRNNARNYIAVYDKEAVAHFKQAFADNSLDVDRIGNDIYFVNENGQEVLVVGFYSSSQVAYEGQNHVQYEYIKGEGEHQFADRLSYGYNTIWNGLGRTLELAAFIPGTNHKKAVNLGNWFFGNCNK